MGTDRMILCMKMKSQRKVKVRISSEIRLQNGNENLFLANASTDLICQKEISHTRIVTFSIHKIDGK